MDKTGTSVQKTHLKYSNKKTVYSTSVQYRKLVYSTRVWKTSLQYKCTEN